MIGWRDVRLGKATEEYTFTVKIKPTENLETFVMFPDYFIMSRYRKFVKVVGVSAFVPVDEDAYGNQYAHTQYLKTDHIEFHASFNQEIDSSDRFICMCNEKLLEPKKYEQYTTFFGFKCWFVDVISGEKLPIADNVKITLQLVLIC